jgi:4-hydroxybenzoate polyprenyltransferase
MSLGDVSGQLAATASPCSQTVRLEQTRWRFCRFSPIPLFGFLYGLRDLNADVVFAAIWLTILSLLMMIHIFSLNDWADYFDDQPHRANRPLSHFERNERLSLLIVASSSAALLFSSLWFMRPARPR